MGKTLLVALIMGAFVLGQAGGGVVTSTDLESPDVSASERGPSENEAVERPAPEPAPVEDEAEERQPADAEAKEPAAVEEEAEEPQPARKEVTSDEARRHKAVAAFLFILPGS
jgi:hypothetical protein